MQIIDSPNLPQVTDIIPNVFHIMGFCISQVNFQLIQSPEKIPESIEEQADLALKNAEKILIEAGSSINQVLRVQVFIPNIDLWGRVNDRYTLFFGDHKPARCIIPTRELHFGCLIEIEVTAALNA